MISDFADPATIVTARAGVRLALVAILQHLPPRQRAVLVLRDVLAFPATDVAVMFGMTTVSVKSALQRARARMAELALAEDKIIEPTAPQARELLDRYIAAFSDADEIALERLWTQDVTLEATPLCSWFKGRSTCIPFLRDHLLGASVDWRMLATSASASASLRRRPIGVTKKGNSSPTDFCVLTVTVAGICRISSFGDPELLTVFGFDTAPTNVDLAD